MQKSIHTPEYNVFLDVLRRLRENANLNQDDMAAKLSVTQSFISKCERGERRLDFVEWLAWCAALEVTPQSFMASYEAALGKRISSGLVP